MRERGNWEGSETISRASQAAEQGLASHNEVRWRTVEQSFPSETDQLTSLSFTSRKRERVDPGTVEYMDYCARIGDVGGKVSMGHLYHSGSHGVGRDQGAALHWFQSAARQGDGMGHSNLGFMQLRSGRHQAAVKSFRRATRLQDVSGEIEAVGRVGGQGKDEECAMEGQWRKKGILTDSSVSDEMRE